MDFSGLNIKKNILDTLLSLKIKTMTTIQANTIPYLLKNNSAVITSQTGSGKTFCYLIPILNGIDTNTNKTSAVIVLPTKELARQVYSNILIFKKNLNNLKVKLLIENEEINKNNTPHIIVGTVSKILENTKNKNINSNISTLVFDEADMLIDFGFSNQTNEIFSYFDSIKLQKIACSATLHESLSNRFSKYLKNTRVFTATASIWTNSQIKQSIIYTNNNSDPINTLMLFLKKINPYFCIIFANTRTECETIYKKMIAEGIESVTYLHKNLSSRQRKHIFNDIKQNKFQYLIASDLLSRGIDIVGADIVISVSLPKENVYYMHRIGRVGRGKTTGESYIIYDNKIDNNINSLSKKIKFNYYFLSSNNTLIEKPLKLKIRKKILFDEQTNNEIKKVIFSNSKKVKPGYKKKIKNYIHKIKQKKKHEYIEKKIKQTLIEKYRNQNRK